MATIPQNQQIQNDQINNHLKSVNTMPSPAIQTSQQNLNMPNQSQLPNNLNRSQTSPPQQQSGGFFSNWWNKFKSNWIIEEEEYIDAHGFKARRPKKKIPLRNTEKALKNQANFEGGDALSKASQYSPFGRLFM